MGAKAGEETPERVEEVKLINLRWDRERAFFGESAMASVEAVVPASCSHLAKVVFKLHVRLAGGRCDFLGTAEAYLRDNRASVSLRMPEDPRAPEGDSYRETEVWFTAQHSRSLEEKGPAIALAEAPEFAGSVFYSPQRNQYLFLETEEELAPWREEMLAVDALRGKTVQAWEILDPVARMDALEDLGKKSEALFKQGDKSEMEELLLIKKQPAWKETPMWAYVRPRTQAPGFWRKPEENEVKAVLRKDMVTKKHKETWVRAGVKGIILKGGALVGGNDPEHFQHKHGPFEIKGHHAFMRYLMGWDGFSAAWKIKEKELKVATGGNVDFSIAEGAFTGSYLCPPEGTDVLDHLIGSKAAKAARQTGRTCRMRLRFDFSPSAFLGMSARASLAFPQVQWDKEPSVKAEVAFSAVAGVQFGGSLTGSLQWSPSLKADFQSLGLLAYEAFGIVGAGADGKFFIECTKTRVILKAGGGLAKWWGFKHGVTLELSWREGGLLIGHLFRCVDHHYLEEVGSSAFSAYANAALAALIKLTLGDAAEAAAENAWERLKGMGREIKSVLFDTSSLRSVLQSTPPIALAAALERLMAVPEARDFGTLLRMLGACGTHQLKWTLRILSGMPLPRHGEPDAGRHKETALREGRKKILGFGSDTPGLHAPYRAYRKEMERLLHGHGL